MKVLVVEDDLGTQLILGRILTKRGHEVTVAETAEAAMKLVQGSFYPLVILDVMLPGMNGIDLCRWLREQPDSARQYVLAGTGSSSSEALQKLLNAGANDYIAKPFSAPLLHIRLAIAENQIQVLHQRKELEDRLRMLARTDSLTGLVNRAYLDSHLPSVVARASPEVPSALLYIDLDNFKIVNDALGHAAGDRLLCTIANELQRAVRPQDTVVRFGGDEFVIVLEKISLTEAETLAERMRDLLDHLVFHEEGRTFPVGVSIGLVAVDGTISPRNLIAGADSACYRAKANGRNRVEVRRGDENDVETLGSEANWRTQIRDALQDDRFLLWSQPISCVRTGRIAFREGLLRLRHTDGTLIGPDAFLPAARRFQLMKDIDRRVIQLILRMLQQSDSGDVSVNLSVESLADPDFSSLLQQTFQAAEVEPRRVILEISEQGIIENFHRARDVIEGMRTLGFRIALDDFGAGFSSLKHLRLLPLDILKIDGAFIRGLPGDPKNQILVRTLGDMAHHLHILTVAEYVDGPETLHLLKDLGVDYAQGRFIGMPTPLTL
ncbi:MAG: hypothetical protein OHK005_19230 [Candidatus Methylacidiphilales bacterium]